MNIAELYILQILVLNLYGIECFRDLAVDLRLKLGDWFRVVQLLKTGGGGGKYAGGDINDCF